jgi:hypothetical protein
LPARRGKSQTQKARKPIMARPINYSLPWSKIKTNYETCTEYLRFKKYFKPKILKSPANEIEELIQELLYINLHLAASRDAPDGDFRDVGLDAFCSLVKFKSWMGDPKAMVIGMLKAGLIEAYDLDTGETLSPIAEYSDDNLEEFGFRTYDWEDRKKECEKRTKDRERKQSTQTCESNSYSGRIPVENQRNSSGKPTESQQFSEVRKEKKREEKERDCAATSEVDSESLKKLGFGMLE